MPELPEVEVVRRGLAPAVSGRRVEHVAVLHPRPVRRHALGADAFAAALVGRTLGVPRRRGKFHWIPLDDGEALVAHLGMSGQFRLDASDAPVQRHARVLVDLDSGVQVRFVDQRMFGGLSLSEGGAESPPEIAHIARDPLDPAYDLDAVVTRLRRKRTGIKRALLDQQLVAGIGNIYADEALWQARMHYARATDTMPRQAAVGVLTAAAQVMSEALAVGGTSFDELYVNVNGDSGYFDRSLHAYGREGEPCPRCGTPIRREAFMNRSSYRCPRCQRTPRAGHLRL